MSYCHIDPISQLSYSETSPSTWYPTEPQEGVTASVCPLRGFLFGRLTEPESQAL